MKIKRKSIISVLLVVAMMFTIAAFTSCSGGDKEESIMVHVKITSSSGEVLCDNDLALEGVASDLTVLAATQKMCVDVLEVEFKHDPTLNAVTQIGADIFDKNALAEDLGEEEAVDEEAAEEDGEAAEVAATDDLSYFDWQCYVNGIAATIDDTVKDKDNIEWKWEKFTPEDV